MSNPSAEDVKAALKKARNNEEGLPVPVWAVGILAVLLVVTVGPQAYKVITKGGTGPDDPHADFKAAYNAQLVPRCKAYMVLYTNQPAKAATHCRGRMHNGLMVLVRPQPKHKKLQVTPAIGWPTTQTSVEGKVVTHPLPQLDRSYKNGNWQVSGAVQVPVKPLQPDAKTNP